MIFLTKVYISLVVRLYSHIGPLRQLPCLVLTSEAWFNLRVGACCLDLIVSEVGLLILAQVLDLADCDELHDRVPQQHDKKDGRHPAQLRTCKRQLLVEAERQLDRAIGHVVREPGRESGALLPARLALILLMLIVSLKLRVHLVLRVQLPVLPVGIGISR